MPRVPIQGLSNVVPPPPPHDGNALLASLPPVHDASASFAPVSGSVSSDGVLDASSSSLIGGVVQPAQDFMSSFGSIMPLSDNFTWITPVTTDADHFNVTQHDHSSCCHYGIAGTVVSVVNCTSKLLICLVIVHFLRL
jgi:hypothetical protein